VEIRDRREEIRDKREERGLVISKVDPLLMYIEKSCNHCRFIRSRNGKHKFPGSEEETYGHSSVFKPLTLVENYEFVDQFPHMFWSDVEGHDLYLFIAFPWFRVEFRQSNTSISQSIDRFQPLASDLSHSVGSDPWKWNEKKQIRWTDTAVAVTG
jgi:hypothetical protein